MFFIVHPPFLVASEPLCLCVSSCFMCVACVPLCLSASEPLGLGAFVPLFL